MPDGGIYWYEEETVSEEEDDQDDMQSEQDYTEVTFESECPTEDDILLGTLPPAPPLADTADLHPTDAHSENELMRALRQKRDQKEANKTTVPGTDIEPYRLPSNKQKQRALSQRPKKLVNEHDSPIGVWEHPQVVVDQEIVATTSAPTPQPRARAPGPATSSRVKRLDAILRRHDDRKAFYLHSADPRHQMVSLQKFWLERINHQMAFVERQLNSLEEGVLRTETNFARAQLQKK